MTTWHASPDLLERFARTPEALDDVAASSVEQHLIGCADCRAVVAEATDPLELGESWARVADVIDRPRATLAERALRRGGVPDDLARIVGATPGLRLAWFATIALFAAGAVAVGRDSGSDAAFLVLAPVIPLGSVLLTFLPAEEPGGEAAAATPLYGAGVVIRRALAALVPTFVILAGAGLALPDLTAASLWLLPGIALATGSLLLATYVRPVTAIATLAAGWITLLVTVRLLDERTVPLARTAVFEPTGQLVALTLSLVAAALLVVRRDRFSTVEVPW